MTVQDAKRYRQEAERCRRLATKMADASMARRLISIAETYEDLARQIEALDNPTKPASG